MIRAIIILVFITACCYLATFVFSIACAAPEPSSWSIGALPSSVRLDPASGRIIDDGSGIYETAPLGDLLAKNWVYDTESVSLHAARGEYVSFQLVIRNNADTALKDIIIEMKPFTQSGSALEVEPELFLEWAVQVKEHTSGYERGSLGGGWYPDALIPLEFIQQDLSRMKNRLTYPLELPDFHNRVDSQRYLLIWVDQYIPFEREKAPAGVYSSELTVSIGGQRKSLPVKLKVWNFAIPRENKFAGNLQHEGFLRRMDERLELSVYQLFKRHRIVPVDPTYTPSISVSPDGKVTIDWSTHDERLGKYFSGEAFTDKYGYSGPGYGEPIELYVLPFDVYGKYGTSGWPDIGKPDVEREPARQAVYIEAIRQVREHMLSMINPEKTKLIVYLNGLDESYFPEAWDRMDFYGKLFDKYFPETFFRVDGSYNEEAMKVIHDAIDYWCCHTIGYNLETIQAYRKLGIKDWLYGPMLYESEKNGWSGSSTFTDLPLVNERAISWSCWKYRTLTFCSWGIGSGWEAAWYNSETFKDIFRDHGEGPLCFRLYNGNAMEIYAPGVIPNVNAPCPSIRLKTMRDGVEEYEFFRMLSELDKGTERADAVVNRIIKQPFGEKSIGNLEIWDYNPANWDAARIEIGEMIEKAVSR
ncbi:MAG TPA: hypothetical protein VM123_20935 [archaeon]|nr:hypothetical protein [archaeon]